MNNIIITEEHLKFLDKLQQSGVTNMMGAGIYLKAFFNITKEDATTILIHWIKTWSERHPNKFNS